MRLSRTGRRRVIAVAVAALSCAPQVGASAAASGADDPCYDAYWHAEAATARSQCQQRAESGDRDAQFGYGLLLWSGRTGPLDRPQAIDWLRKSALQGHPIAQVTLVTFLTDPGSPTNVRNPVEGFAWSIVTGMTTSRDEIAKQLSPAQTRDGLALAGDLRARLASRNGSR